jgi:hypothetical protein
VPGRCLPYEVSAESFEETDTARKPWLQIQGWAISSDAATGWLP